MCGNKKVPLFSESAELSQWGVSGEKKHLGVYDKHMCVWNYKHNIEAGCS